MAKPKPASRSIAHVADPLYQEIRLVLESARAGAHRAVNAAMVHAYWQVGRLIVENELGGRKRAAYGEAVLDELARQLTVDFGRGFTTTNLRYMRSFFLAFPIHHALRDESAATTTYMKILPTEAQLAREMEREQRLLRASRPAKRRR